MSVSHILYDDDDCFDDGDDDDVGDAHRVLDKGGGDTDTRIADRLQTFLVNQEVADCKQFDDLSSEWSTEFTTQLYPAVYNTALKFLVDN